MNIINIAYKEFVQSFRDVTVMTIMIVFPVLIIFFIGMSFSGIEEQKVSLNDTPIEYFVNNEPQENLTNIEILIKGLKNSGLIVFASSNLDNSLSRLANYDAFGVLEFDNGTITYHQNERTTRASTFVSSIVFSNLDVYEKNNVFNPNNEEYNAIPIFIDSNIKPTILDYYGVAMLILFIVYGISNPVSYTIKENTTGKLKRIIASPVETRDIVIGKLLGNTLINLLQVTMVFIITILFFNVNWGNDLIKVYLLIITNVLLIVSIGLLIGLSFKNESFALSIVHTLIVLVAFFGGSYMTLDGLGFLGNVGKYFSPIWWNISGIMSFIYSGSDKILNQAFIINISFTLLFTILSFFRLSYMEVEQ